MMTGLWRIVNRMLEAMRVPPGEANGDLR